MCYRITEQCENIWVQLTKNMTNKRIAMYTTIFLYRQTEEKCELVHRCNYFHDKNVKTSKLDTTKQII